MSDTPEFADFFDGVWGYQPHRWQADLAAQVIADGRWPDVIDLPTGAGKTACLDIAVFALAVHPSVFPRRVAFVVDRRLIVDQTVERAVRLAAVLDGSLTTDDPHPAVRAIADRLVRLSFQPPGRDPVALDVGRLRGGSTGGGAVAEVGAGEWLRWPDRPAVIVSTVDQFGSRLLFRGYGVGPRMQPIHAGLTGNDCLVLLDEVHVSAPLAETLGDLATVFEPVRALPRRWQFVQMSATPIGSPTSSFELADRHVVPGSQLAQVVEARKLARLVEIGKPKQSAAVAWSDAAHRLVADLRVEHGVVGVVVNRVASARAVAEALGSFGEVVLLTGRMRPFERAVRERRARELADPDRPDNPERSFVVATQCIEVGADLSFDGLVTEVSTLSSLRQRFGRLDRRGRRSAAGEPAPALVVGVAPALARDSDPVYGTAMKAMWDALRERFPDEPFDVGPRSAMLAGFGDDVDTPARHPAVLMPAHLDLLSMTNPAPPGTPDVAPFLRGFERGEPDVALVWRADIGCTAESWPVDRLLLEVMPPSPLEMVPLPRSAVVRWLTSAAEADAADVDEVAGESVDRDSDGRTVLRWKSGEAPESVSAAAIAPGDVLVVPASYGGLVGGAWAPESLEPVVDVAGPASAQTGTAVLRTAVDLDSPGPQRPTDDLVAVFRSEVRLRLEQAAESGDWFGGLDAARLEDIGPERRPVWVVIGRAVSNVATFDGSDTANSLLGTTRPVTLASHLAGVGEYAAEFAARCFLPEALVSDLRLAGELHDLGKADPRFQTMLHGDEIAALAAPEPLAKSTHRRWRFRGGYPPGMRHEFASAELVAASDLLSRAHDPDLVMHLVTTHHGHGRALAVHVIDPDPQTIEIDSHGCRLTASSTFDSDTTGTAAVERFARLTERFGWHGLAWLESLFRLSDHRRSEEESRGTAA